MSNPAIKPLPKPTSLQTHDHRLQKLFMVLGGFFIGNALLAELIGGKLFEVNTGISWSGAPFKIIMSSGIVLWPLVFIMTDIINEYFGRAGVRRLSLLAAAIIAYAFIALWAAGSVPTWENSPVKAESFRNVFIQSQFIIVGSIAAFLVAQLIDVTVFWLIRRQTGHKWLWLRATGSTVISQIVDSYMVGFIGLYLPYVLKENWPERFANAGGLSFHDFLKAQTAGYIFKLVVAVGITPVLYIVHAAIDRYLGEKEAEAVIEQTAQHESAA